MLTGSDSPRPDQQALAHCTAWALLIGKRAHLGGGACATASTTMQTQRGSSEPAVKECVSVYSTTDWYISHCQPLLLPLACRLLPFIPALSVYNPHPPSTFCSLLWLQYTYQSIGVPLLLLAFYLFCNVTPFDQPPSPVFTAFKAIFASFMCFGAFRNHVSTVENENCVSVTTSNTGVYHNVRSD